MGLGKLLEMAVRRLTRLSIKTEVWGKGQARSHSIMKGNSTPENITGKCLWGKAEGKRMSFPTTFQTSPSRFYCGRGGCRDIDSSYIANLLGANLSAQLPPKWVRYCWPWNLGEEPRSKGYRQKATLDHRLLAHRHLRPWEESVQLFPGRQLLWVMPWPLCGKQYTPSWCLA